MSSCGFRPSSQLEQRGKGGRAQKLKWKGGEQRERLAPIEELQLWLAESANRQPLFVFARFLARVPDLAHP